MKHYVIIKKATLEVGEKKFHKDQIVTAEDVGQPNIDRWLKKGYIKFLGDNGSKNTTANAPPPGGGAVDNPPPGGGGEQPFYMTTEDFLTPEQVDGLERKEALEYAGRIGLVGFAANIRTDALKKLIDGFIVEAKAAAESDNDDDNDDDDDGGDDDSEGEQQP